MHFLKMTVGIAKLAYLADICEHLNELNIKMQGKNENILTCSDKLKGFKEKIVLWKNELIRGSLEMFPRSNQVSAVDKDLALDLSQKHLAFTCIVMQEARDALSKLQTVTLFRPIRSLQCSW